MLLGQAATPALDVRDDDEYTEVELRLRRGGGSAHVYFSDLTHDYVELNSAYTT